MGIQDKDSLVQLSLPPGFRFYPTDEELLVQYLCRKVAGHHFSLQIIAEIDLYKFDPWVLPSKAMFGEKEWYFFSPRERKYPNGSRPNRVAGSGYWKATGTDKVITTQGKKVGIKKALVFYVGKAPKGTKSNWIMHEYRLTEPTRKTGSSKLDDWVLCRIYKKKSSGGVKPTISKEYSTGGSSSTSSSHLDDVLESLPVIGGNNNESSLGLPRETNNVGPLQQEDRFNLQHHLGSGNFDWAVLASIPEFGFVGSSQAQSGQVNTNTNVNVNELFGSTLPPLAQADEPGDNKYWNSMIVDDEVQSGVRTQRINNNRNMEYYNYNHDPSNILGHNSSSPMDPFGIRYSNQPGGYGFGYRQ